MNILFTDTVTIYNFFRDKETGEENWNRTVIKGVQWSHNKSEVSVSGGVQSESKVERITIDFSRNYGNSPYLPPQEYRKLTREERAKCWTLDQETGQDIIVYGESEIEVGENYRLSHLRNDFQYVCTVTSVSDNCNRPRLKHIKVVAK